MKHEPKHSVSTPDEMPVVDAGVRHVQGVSDRPPWLTRGARLMTFLAALAVTTPVMAQNGRADGNCLNVVTERLDQSGIDTKMAEIYTQSVRKLHELKTDSEEGVNERPVCIAVLRTSGLDTEGPDRNAPLDSLGLDRTVQIYEKDSGTFKVMLVFRFQSQERGGPEEVRMRWIRLDADGSEGETVQDQNLKVGESPRFRLMTYFLPTEDVGDTAKYRLIVETVEAEGGNPYRIYGGDLELKIIKPLSNRPNRVALVDPSDDSSSFGANLEPGEGPKESKIDIEKQLLRGFALLTIIIALIGRFLSRENRYRQRDKVFDLEDNVSRLFLKLKKSDEVLQRALDSLARQQSKEILARMAHAKELAELQREIEWLKEINQKFREGLVDGTVMVEANELISKINALAGEFAAGLRSMAEEPREGAIALFSVKPDIVTFQNDLCDQLLATVEVWRSKDHGRARPIGPSIMNPLAEEYRELVRLIQAGSYRSALESGWALAGKLEQSLKFAEEGEALFAPDNGQDNQDKEWSAYVRRNKIPGQWLEDDRLIDFFELMGIPPANEWTIELKKSADKKLKILSKAYHPDSNKIHDSMFKKVAEGRDIFQNQDATGKYIAAYKQFYKSQS